MKRDKKSQKNEVFFKVIEKKITPIKIKQKVLVDFAVIKSNCKISEKAVKKTKSLLNGQMKKISAANI